jgi:hypothetical protein
MGLPLPVVTEQVILLNARRWVITTLSAQPLRPPWRAGQGRPQAAVTDHDANLDTPSDLRR